MENPYLPSTNNASKETEKPMRHHPNPPIPNTNAYKLNKTGTASQQHFDQDLNDRDTATELILPDIPVKRELQQQALNYEPAEVNEF